MSKEFNASLCVGYIFNAADLSKKFAEPHEEMVHYEDRYDPRTGKKLDKKEKVIDKPACVVYTFDEHLYYSDDMPGCEEQPLPPYELWEAIAKKLDCEVSVFGIDRLETDYYIVFGPDLSPHLRADEFSCYDVEIGSSLSCGALTLLKPELERIKEALAALDIKVKNQPKIHIAWGVSE